MGRRLCNLNPHILIRQALSLAILFILSQQVYAQCDGSTDVGGTVFRDLPAGDPSTANVYSVQDLNESGLPGIQITVTDANGAIQSDITDMNGGWSVDPAIYPIRIEFSWTDTNLFPSHGGGSTNTVVRFASAADCAMNLGLHYPEDYSQMVPEVVTSCYVAGDPLGGGSSGTVDAIVSFPFNQTGDVVEPDKDALLSEVGGVWGIAYNQYEDEAYFSAIMKRHVGLGSQGIGGIYKLNYTPSTPAVANLINLSAFGVDLGTEPTRDLSADFDGFRTDSLMFDAPGKLGIGDIDISGDGNTLFAMNLYSRKVVTVDLTNYNVTKSLPNGSDIDSLPALPDPSCTLGESRPFGLKFWRGELYAGVVCSGENGGATSDLSATVYVFNFTSNTWSTVVNTFSLDYPRGGVVDNDCSMWEPWIGTYDDVFTGCRPSPILSDIEFDVDGSMLLAFADRNAFQKFTLQRDVDDTGSESVVSGGDILRVYYNGVTYTPENNGTTAAGGGCGINNQGPGNGEYYCGEFIGTEHSETAMGAAAMLAGSGQLLLTVINPVNYNSGGIRLFDNATGASSPTEGYQLYATPGSSFPSGNGYAVKGGGLGDVEILSEPAPLEIGNTVWEDTNNDGVQDPGETPIAGVQVSLFDVAGNLLWEDVTNASGQYFFSDTLRYNTSYYVVFGTDGDFNLGNSTFQDSLYVTQMDMGTGMNADLHDSDGSLANAILPVINGYPYIPVTTGWAGANNSNYAVGFAKCPSIPALVIGANTPLCADTDLDLTETGGDATMWEWTGPDAYTSNDQNPTISMVTTAATGTYNLTITDGNSCTNTGTVDVVVNALPTAALDAAGPFCINNSAATLVGNPIGGVFSGSGIVDANAGTFSPSTAGVGLRTITYTVTDVNGCEDAQTIDIQVNSLPMATLDAAGPFCVNDPNSVTLNGLPGGGLYSGSGITDTNAGTFDPAIAGVGTHTITYNFTDGNNCTVSVTRDIVIDDIPTVNINGAGPYCFDDAAVNLTASPTGGVYSGDGITDGALGTFDPSIAGAGTHTISYDYTDGNSCSNTATAQIVVNDVPTITFNTQSSVCISVSSLNFSATPSGGTFSGMGITNGNTGRFEPEAAGVGPHTITYTYMDANGCIGVSTSDITVNDLPTVSMDPTGPFCLGSAAVNLTVSPTGGFFSGPGITDAINGTFSPSVAGAGTFTISYTFFDANSCVNSDEILISVGNCNGTIGDFVWNDDDGDGIQDPGENGIDSVTVILYDANTNSPLDTTYTNDTGAYGFTGFPNGTYYLVFDPSSNKDNLTNIFGVPTGAGTTTEDNDADPSTFQTASFSFDSGLGDDISVDAGFFDCSSISFDNSTEQLCSGGTTASIAVNTSAVGINKIALVYFTSPQVGGDMYVGGTSLGLSSADGESAVFTDVSLPANNTNNPVIYYVYAILNPTPSIGSCRSFAELQVTVDPAPNIFINSNSPTCEGTILSITEAGGDAEFWNWSGPNGFTASSQNSSVNNTTILDGGIYRVTVTDASGCTNVDTRTLTIHAQPSVTLAPESNFCLADTPVNLVGSPLGGTYSGLGITDVVNGTFDPSIAGSGTHTLTYSYIDGNGCTNMDQILVAVSGCTGEIGNFVWLDVNADGIQDPGEPGIDSVLIVIYDANTNMPIDTSYTDELGGNTFFGLPVGNYYMEFDPTGNTSGYQNLEGVPDSVGQALTDSDPNPLTGFTTVFFFDPNAGDELTIDAGYFNCPDILNPTMAQAICENDVISSLEITTDEIATDGISFVYYTTQQTGSDMYDGNGTLLGTATPSGGMASITNVSLPATPQTYYVYAILTTTPALGTCRPFQEIEITLSLCPGSIGDLVWLDTDENGVQNIGEPGIEGVAVMIFNANNNAPIDTVYTDASGIYTIPGQPDGDYYLVFDPTTNVDGLTSLVGSPTGNGSTTNDNDANPATGQTVAFTFTFTYGSTESDIDAGFIDCSAVANVPGSNTPVCEGDDLNLTETGGDAIDWNWSGPNSFSSSDQNPTIMAAAANAAGTYSVTITTSNGCTSVQTEDVVMNNCSAGSIGDFVWLDTDGNGVQDLGEPGIDSVMVILFDANTDQPIDTVYTDGSGTYTIPGPPAGDYYLVFDPTTNVDGLSNLLGSPTTVGNPALDSNADPTSGQSNPFTFDPLIPETGIDAGFIDCSSFVSTPGSNTPVCEGDDLNLTETGGDAIDWNWSGPNSFSSSDQSPTIMAAAANAAGTYSVTITTTNGCTVVNTTDVVMNNCAAGMIGDFVWLDTDGNGVQDLGEPGIDSVMVILFDANTDQPIDTVYTDGSGTYTIPGPPAGDYYLVFDPTTNVDGLSNLLGSPTTVGNPALDSNADPISGQSNPFTFDPLIPETGIDAGFIDCSAIANVPGSNTPICDGTDLNLTETGGDAIDWNWSGPDSFSSSDQNPTITAADINASGTYSVTITTTNGCTSVQTEDVVVNALPMTTLDDAGPFCTTGSSVTLNGQPAGGTYAGTGITDVNAGTFDPATAGAGAHLIDYTFTDGNNCSSTVQIPLVVSLCSGSIGDFVWMDNDGNGVQDLGEPGIDSVQVILFNANTDMPMDTVYSNSAGFYSFQSPPAGDFYIVFDPSTNNNGFTNMAGSPTGMGTSTTDSDADPLSGQTNTFTFNPASGDELDIDAGFYTGGVLGNRVWLDLDGDGVQSGLETGIGNVKVILYDANTMMPIDSVNTSGMGFYSFSGLPMGDYYVEIDWSTLPDSYILSPQDMGGDDTTDSDINPTTGQSVTVTLGLSQFDDSLDAGLVPVAEIGDFVWEDLNGNGIQDMGEPGIEGVTVSLYDDNDNLIETVLTGPNGEYTFTNIGAGNYYLDFDATTNTAGASYSGSPIDASTDDEDSDADPNTGITATFTFDPANGSNDNMDAGFLIDCPSVDAGPDQSICMNSDAALLATGGTSYVWSPANSLDDANIENPTASPLATTKYFVTVSTVSGCTGVDSVTVTVNPSPFVDATIDTNPSGCLGTDGSISVTAMGGMTYLYSNDGGMTFQPSNLFENLMAGNYSIVVANSDTTCVSPVTIVSLTDNTTVCSDILDVDTMVVEPGMAPIVCLPLPFADVTDYEITLNGNAYTDPVTGCTIDTMAMMATEVNLSGVGVYNLVFRNTNTCCLDTVVVAVLDQMEPDTIYDITPFETTINTLCADISDLPGEFTTITTCREPGAGTITLGTDECVTYEPNPGYIGLDTLCFSVCDDFGVCDTTVMFVTITPPPCDEVLVTTNETIMLDDCADLGYLCLNLSLSDLGGFNITDNGATYNAGVQACDFDTTYFYVYTGLDGAGANGPYMVDDWTVDGTIFSGQVADMTALTDSLNVWDPIGNWTLDVGSSTINGGNASQVYGHLMTTHIASSISETLQLNISMIPVGTRLAFSQGSHEVVFTKASTGCMDTVNVDVICDNCEPIFASPISIESDDCEMPTQYCTSISINEIINYSITNNGAPYTGGIFGCDSDTIITYSYANFPGLGSSGPYNLDAWTVDANVFSGDFADISDLVDSMNVWDPTGNWMISGVQVEGGNYSQNYGDIVVSQFGTVVAISNPNIQNIPASAAVSLEVGTHQVVFTNTVEGCSDTLNIEVTCPDCPVLFEPIATLGVNDCSDSAPFCMAINPLDIANYTIEDNGIAYNGSFQGCEFDSLQSYLTVTFNMPGAYTVDSWTVDGTDYTLANFSTPAELVDSMNVWDVNGNWSLNGLVISGGDELRTYGNLVISSAGTPVADAAPSPQLIAVSTSIELDTGYHEIVIINTLSGCVDTAFVTVDCGPCTDVISAAEMVVGSYNCDEPTSVCLEVATEELQRYNITDNGTPYTQTLEGCAFDSTLTYNYVSLPGNGTFGPYNIEGWEVNGTTFTGQFEDVAGLLDSLNTWDPTANWVEDPITFIISGANPNNIYGPLEIRMILLNSLTVLQPIIDLTPISTALYLETGLHQMVFTDNLLGCSDTLDVTVACIETAIWIDTTFIGSLDTICLDTSELLGNIVSIQNVCPDASGEKILIDFIDGYYCFTSEGVEIGTDTACIVICDDLGWCDTTHVYITAVPGIDPPIASPDLGTTIQGDSVVISIIDNDVAGNLEITDMFISVPPNFGTATINSTDGTITYVPNAGYCNSQIPDSLTYVLCNAAGCDSATVSITVACTDLTFHNGFSPNGDGVNDVFLIEGLSLYPNNVLCCYNRWGNQVFRMEGYDNTWDGSWENSNLPDGTYFYVFTDGEGNTHSGYVQIQR